MLVQGGGVLPGRALGTDESGGRTGSVDEAKLTVGSPGRPEDSAAGRVWEQGWF